MVAMGGVLLALSVATVFGASIIPGVELTLYLLSSLFIGIIMIETSPKFGWLFYLGTIILSFFLIPNKVGVIPYGFLFGLYPILKFYIENKKRLPFAIEIIIKLAVFNIILITGYRLLGIMIFGAVSLPDFSMPIIFAALQVFFLVYDYVFTMIIVYYLKRRPRMNI